MCDKNCYKLPKFICDQLFFRVGYYVRHEYDDLELQENPPEPPQVEKLSRNILESNPRVTKFKIEWEDLPPQPTSGGDCKPEMLLQNLRIDSPVKRDAPLEVDLIWWVYSNEETCYLLIISDFYWSLFGNFALKIYCDLYLRLTNAFSLTRVFYETFEKIYFDLFYRKSYSASPACNLESFVWPPRNRTIN